MGSSARFVSWFTAFLPASDTDEHRVGPDALRPAPARSSRRAASWHTMSRSLMPISRRAAGASHSGSRMVHGTDAPRLRAAGIATTSLVKKMGTRHPRPRQAGGSRRRGTSCRRGDGTSALERRGVPGCSARGGRTGPCSARCARRSCRCNQSARPDAAVSSVKSHPRSHS